MLTFSLFDNFYAIAAASGYSLTDSITKTSYNYEIELSPGQVYDLPEPRFLAVLCDAKIVELLVKLTYASIAERCIK